MRLGERIYTLRTGKNLSQGDLADALDVSRQSISKWETGSSVPELDKLIKLSEIFGVSLDELVLDKKPEETQPAPQQIVYVEKAAPGSTRKVVGTILMCFGALVWLLVTLLGDVVAGLVMASPFVLCGLICLIARRNAGLWCAWAVYFTVDVYMRYASGVNWRFAFWAIHYAAEWTVHLIVAWCILLCFAVLTVVTVLRFRAIPLAASGKNILLTVSAWVLFGLTCIPVSFDVTSQDMIWWVQVIGSAMDWVGNVLLVTALVLSARLLKSRKGRRS